MIYSNIVLITIELRILLARVHGFIDDLKGDTMNSLRNKLIASVTMLAVAAIMLTSASFAWYTVSQKGEVSQVKVEMSATENIEIAKAIDAGDTVPVPVAPGQTGDETKYGTTVTGSKVTLQNPATLATDSVISAPTYEEDGRLGYLVACATQSFVAPTGDTTDGGYYTAKDTSNKLNAIVYGVWVRSNTYENVNLNITNTAGPGKATCVVRDGATVYEDGATVPLGGVDNDKYLEIVIYYEGSGLTAADVDAGIAEDTFKIEFVQPAS